MYLNRALQWARGGVLFGAVLSISSAAARMLAHDRTQTLWEIALSPATIALVAATVWVQEDPGTSSPRRRRWAAVFGTLALLCGIASFYVLLCVRGACVVM